MYTIVLENYHKKQNTQKQQSCKEGCSLKCGIQEMAEMVNVYANIFTIN